MRGRITLAQQTRGHTANGLNPVSYTHLDVYKRQNRCLELIDHIIKGRRGIVAQTLNVKECLHRSNRQHLLKDARCV